MAVRSERIRADLHTEIIWIDTDDLFKPGHHVYDWSLEVATQLTEAVRTTVPPTTSKSRWGHIGTGRLKSSIKMGHARIAPNEIAIACHADTPYAMFVHGGTAYARGAFIYSRLGWANKPAVDAMVAARTPSPANTMRKKVYKKTPLMGLYMSLPPGPGGRRRFHLRVRGQKANPFLVRGYNRMALFHDSDTFPRWEHVVGL